MNVDCRQCAGVWITARGQWQHDLNAVLLLLVLVVVLVWPHWVMDMRKVNSRGIICVAAEPRGFNTRSIFTLMASLLQPLRKGFSYSRKPAPGCTFSLPKALRWMQTYWIDHAKLIKHKMAIALLKSQISSWTVMWLYLTVIPCTHWKLTDCLRTLLKTLALNVEVNPIC